MLKEITDSKENKETAGDVFYTCYQISIDKSVNKYKIKIVSSLPDTLIPNSFVLLRNENNIWQLFYYNYFLERIQCELDGQPNPTLINHLKKIDKAPEKLSKEEIENIKNIFRKHAPSAKLNLGFQVAIGQSNCGEKLLFSMDFGPCQAVVARMINNKYAIYHASSMADNEPLQAFTAMIKNKVIDVFVIQKQSSITNLTKGPYLAVNIAKYLPNIPVKTLEVKNYTCIVVFDNEIILGEKIDKEEQLDEILTTSPKTRLNLSTSQSIEENIIKIFEESNNSKEIYDTGFEKFTLSIPKTLISSTAQFVLNKNHEQNSKHEQNLKKEEKYNQYNQKFFNKMREKTKTKELTQKENLKVICYKEHTSCCTVL